MWIVLVVDNYYPSVFPFKNESDARRFYEENKEVYGSITHLVEVKETHIGEDCEIDKDTQVDWR